MDSNIVILMFIAIVFVGGLMLAIIATTRKKGQKLDVEKYQARLLQIEALLEKRDSAAYQMAILNADKLLDQALREKGLKGTTMGERLKNANSYFNNVNAVWTAHKMRNQIAHDDNVSIGYDQARRAINTFRAGLRDLGAIR